MAADPKAMETELLTKREAAELMRVSEISVHRLIVNRKLAAYRVGRKVFTTRSFISDFLARTVQAVAA